MFEGHFVVALLCVGALALVIPKTAAQDDVSYGLKMSGLAYQVVCWYETLKQFPRTNATAFQDCTGGGIGMGMIYSGDDALSGFGPGMVESAMPILPPEYGSNCNQYLVDPRMQFPMNEGDALNDNRQGAYPWQGYSYCMVNTLRKKFGDQAIQSVKSEKTQGSKPWMQTIFDRDNEWRLRHGVPPFELNNESKSSRMGGYHSCREGHSSSDAPFRQWRDDITGESFYAASGSPDTTTPADAAYFSSDGWYEEIRFYPYPQGYQGDETDDLFEAIGHFTQTVWSDTKYVGYGFAYKVNCENANWYLIARYAPMGNLQGKYQDYVFPPKM